MCCLFDFETGDSVNNDKNKVDPSKRAEGESIKKFRVALKCKHVLCAECMVNYIKAKQIQWLKP